LRVPIERFLYSIQEFCANDATSAPNGSDIAEVKVPMVMFAGRRKQSEALRIGNDFGGVKGVPDCVDELCVVALILTQCRCGQYF
jgi:hypothetical protein